MVVNHRSAESRHWSARDRVRPRSSGPIKERRDPAVTARFGRPGPYSSPIAPTRRRPPPAATMASARKTVSLLLRSTSSRLHSRAATHVRCLATPSSTKPAFAKTLEDGPSLDDFIAGDAQERVVLGNTSQYVVKQ